MEKRKTGRDAVGPLPLLATRLVLHSKQPASAVTGAAEMQTAPSSAQGGRRRGRRHRSDMYDAIRCAAALGRRDQVAACA